MTPQLNTTPTYPDARIDQILNALRTTEAPVGLEERIAARLAQAAEARTHSATASASPTRAISSFFAVILNAVKDPRILPVQAKIFATVAIALTLLAALSVLHYRATTTQPETPSVATTPAPQGFSLGSHQVHQEATVLAPALSQATHDRAPQGFSLGAHPTQIAAEILAPDPDAIALAETLAPSLAAPPMPFTPQEQLIASATRPGQPIQLAELDIAREPYLRAEAAARTNVAIERYVHTLLAPFAAADALQPTNFAQPREISASAPAPQPTTSLSN